MRFRSDPGDDNARWFFAAFGFLLAVPVTVLAADVATWQGQRLPLLPFLVAWVVCSACCGLCVWRGMR